MFSPGLYNQQRSSYVGSTLGEFMNLLPHAQQRYDTSRDLIDNSDAFIDQLDYLEGDRDDLIQITSPFRDSINQARESGDYRGLYDSASRLSKKVVNDKGLKVISQSYQNAMKQRELEAQYGTSALSFTNPDQHKSITYDETGKPNYNVYVPKVEKMLDWDKRRQDIYSILKADGFTTGLQEARSEIEGFLQTGNIKTISNKKVLEYLDNSFRRYLETPEGLQEYRKLTEIDGLTPEQANVSIQSSLLDVGEGMIFSDTNMSYMQNPAYQQAMKAQQSQLAGPVNYSGASDVNSIANPFYNKIAVDKKGDIVTNVSFDKILSETKGMGSLGVLDNPVTDFVKSSLEYLYRSVTGNLNESTSNPVQQNQILNVKESLAVKYNIPVSEVRNEMIVDHINNNMKYDLPSVPVVGLSEDDTKTLGNIYSVKANEDGVISGQQFTNHKFYHKGQMVSFENMMKNYDDISQIDIVSKFGNDNAWGIPGMPGQIAGYMVQMTDKDGKQIRVPMQYSALPENNPDAVLENAIHETKYNQAGGITLRPRSLGNMQFHLRRNLANDDITMFDHNTGKEIVKVTSQELDQYFTSDEKILELRSIGIDTREKLATVLLKQKLANKQ